MTGRASTTGACVPCPGGKFNDDSYNSACTACAAGQYQDEPGKTSCKNTSCPDGKIRSTATGLAIVAGACVDCWAGKFNSFRHTDTTCSAHTCAAGHMVALTSSTTSAVATCVPCPIGKFLSAGGAGATCQFCEAGTYQDQTAQNACNVGATCPSGKYLTHLSLSQVPRRPAHLGLACVALPL